MAIAPMDRPVIDPERATLTIPAYVRDLDGFRRWSQTDEFPEKGGVSWIRGEILIEMAPPNPQRHGSLQSAIGTALYTYVVDRDLGQVFINSAQMSLPTSDMATQSDVMFVAWESLESGRVRPVPTRHAKGPSDVAEYEGPVDLVVEVLSPSSIRKDRVKLPAALFDGGVREYWLADATGDGVTLSIHHRGENAFEAAATIDGKTRSDVLAADVSLTRRPGRAEGTIRFSMTIEPVEG